MRRFFGKRVLLWIFVLLLGAGLSGCGKGSSDERPAKPDTPAGVIVESNMLFDSYEATVATVGGDGYDEFVLYDHGGEGLILARYGTGAETPKTCIVPDTVFDDCMAVVRQYGMDQWKNGHGMTGKICVVKFLHKGEIVRVSSEMMPDGKESAFSDARRVLTEAWAEYYNKEAADAAS
ncbi:MAG: hypothetical protein IIY46_10345 [Lachnospiraceae bacterium]|nr:hypothetical protein [Lachnospiraceae bacterium]